MTRAASIALLLLVLAGCGTGREETDPGETDGAGGRRLVVVGPSLVELAFACGLGGRVVAVDRFSDWPPEAGELPDVGGYLDPSLEAIAAAEPTAILSVGRSPVLQELAGSLDVPYLTYEFDSLEDFMTTLDRLERELGAEPEPLRTELSRTLDSLATVVADSFPGGPPSAALVVHHEPGSSSMMLAGGGTFLAGLLSEVGVEAAAPASANWPTVSIEGMMALAPDRVLLLLPGCRDSSAYLSADMRMWEELGWGERVVHLFEPYLLVPGARLPETARRLVEALL